MTSEPPSRAAEVLERLARADPRPGPLSAVWERVVRAVGASSVGVDVEPDHPGAPSSGPRRARGPLRTVVVAVAMLVVLAVVLLERRPEPIDQRLPMAASTTAEVPSEGSSAPSEPATADSGMGQPPTEPDEPGAAAEVVVHVAGAVTRPGVVRLPASSRAVDAVAAAGGLRPDADPDRVNLAAGLVDGQRVVVPVIGQPPPLEAVPAPAQASPAQGAPGGEVVALIDINTADGAQLEELPGVGPATAAAILAHREERGPFASVDSLIDVRGIGEAKLEALRDLVVVNGGP